MNLGPWFAGGAECPAPRCNLDLEISSENFLASQEGLGFIFNTPRVLRTLLFDGCPTPLIQTAQHFPSAAWKGTADTDSLRSQLTDVPVSHSLGLLEEPQDKKIGVFMFLPTLGQVNPLLSQTSKIQSVTVTPLALRSFCFYICLLVLF